MPIETSPTSIADLNSSYPAAGDVVAQGDDHLRNLKTVLKTTFPGSGGLGFSIPITVTEAQLNLLTGLTATAAELNILDGVVGVSASEITYLSNVTSDIQAQIDAQVTSFNIDSDSGSPEVISDGETISIVGGEGIDVTHSGNTLTVAGENSTDSNKGVVELADNTEADNGTATAVVMTPEQVRRQLDGSATSPQVIASAAMATDLTHWKRLLVDNVSSAQDPWDIDFSADAVNHEVIRLVGWFRSNQSSAEHVNIQYHNGTAFTAFDHSYYRKEDDDSEAGGGNTTVSGGGAIITPNLSLGTGANDYVHFDITIFGCNETDQPLRGHGFLVIGNSDSYLGHFYFGTNAFTDTLEQFRFDLDSSDDIEAGRCTVYGLVNE